MWFTVVLHAAVCFVFHCWCIFPISVAMPVVITRAREEPLTTVVPANAMHSFDCKQWGGMG